MGEESLSLPKGVDGEGKRALAWASTTRLRFQRATRDFDVEESVGMGVSFDISSSPGELSEDENTELGECVRSRFFEPTTARGLRGGGRRNGRLPGRIGAGFFVIVEAAATENDVEVKSAGG